MTGQCSIKKGLPQRSEGQPLFDSVPGTGPFDSLAKSARSLTVPALDAQKGRKHRDPLGCPEPGPDLTVRANWQKFDVISVATIEELATARPGLRPQASFEYTPQ